METVQMDFNPEEISYRELLEIFWMNHSPEYSVASRQYMSAIHFHNENQKAEALQSLAQKETEFGTKLYTQIMPLERFYLAEAYHQKFYLQQVGILKDELKSLYSSFKEFVNSRAAARVNGYVKGIGNMEMLMKEIDEFGLSDRGKKRLIDIVDSYE